MWSYSRTLYLGPYFWVLISRPTYAVVDSMSPWFYEDRMKSEIKPILDFESPLELESPPWDLWGLFLSTLCLVHCLLTPVIVLILPSLVPNWLRAEGHSHNWFFFGLVFIAGLSVAASFRRHRRWNASAWLVCGLIIVGIATFVLDGNWEYGMSLVGSLALLRGHYLNRKYCKLCEKLPVKPVCCSDTVPNLPPTKEQILDKI